MIHAGKHVQGRQPGDTYFSTSRAGRHKMPEASTIGTLAPSPLREERKTIVERRGPAVDVPGYCGVRRGGTIRIHYLQLNDTERNFESVLVQCACQVHVVQNLLGCICLRPIPLGVRAVGCDTHVDDLLTGRAPRRISNVVGKTKDRDKTPYNCYESEH